MELSMLIEIIIRIWKKSIWRRGQNLSLQGPLYLTWINFNPNMDK